MSEPYRLELVCPLCKGKFTESIAGLKCDPALVCPMCGTLMGKAALAKAIKDARELVRLKRLLGEMSI
jgi:hypothetical protein